MRKVIQSTILLLAVLLAAGCISPVQRGATGSSVTGNVIYNGQIDVADVALVTVELRDVSDGLPSSNLVNQQQIATSGNPPPYPFEVSFAPSAIDQSRTYALVAFIQDAAGHIIYRSDSPVAVLTQGASMKDIDVAVMPVDRNPGVDTAQEQAQASGLTGELWEVVSLNDNPPAADTTITAQFGEDGTLSGSDGCNRYSASYTVDGAAITITPGIGTMMACPEPAMTQAATYMAALTAATAYTIDGSELMLTDASGAPVLLFRVVEQSLAGTNWSAIFFNDSGSAIVSVTGVQITAAFGADGQVSGFGGCNNYAATYTIGDANAIEIGPIIATQMACSAPANVMEQESQYLAALQSAVVFQVQGQTLEMQNSAGQMAVQYQRAQ